MSSLSTFETFLRPPPPCEQSCTHPVTQNETGTGENPRAHGRSNEKHVQTHTHTHTHTQHKLKIPTVPHCKVFQSNCNVVWSPMDAENMASMSSALISCSAFRHLRYTRRRWVLRRRTRNRESFRAAWAILPPDRVPCFNVCSKYRHSLANENSTRYQPSYQMHIWRLLKFL